MRDELLWYQPRACVIEFCIHASIQEASTTKIFIYSPFTKTFFFYLNDKQSFGRAMLKFEKKPSYLMKIISCSIIYLNIRYLRTSEPSPFYQSIPSYISKVSEVVKVVIAIVAAGRIAEQENFLSIFKTFLSPVSFVSVVPSLVIVSTSFQNCEVSRSKDFISCLLLFQLIFSALVLMLSMYWYQHL